MIVSMTGFGDAAREVGGTHYAVEVRALNNRFFKATVRLPDTLVAMEPEIDSLLREKLGRGTITYALRMRADTADVAYPINAAALDSYVRQIQAVPALKGVPLDLSALLALPGVCQEPADESHDVERHGPTVRELTRAALDKLLLMRRREGEALWADLDKHLTLIEQFLAAVEKRAPGVVHEYHKRVAQRVNELIGKAELRVTEADLLREVAVFAERSDISEEIQRLRHHVRQFRDSCHKGEHAGRKLDFIAQEMLREANTIGSKALDGEVSVAIVEIKGAIDRLKEQAQNVE